MSDKLTPLGRLIQAAQDDLGWSNRELERQAGDMRGLGKSNIGKLKTETLPSFKAETIQNLSKLIRVPEVVVVQAALDTMGVRYSHGAPATLEDAVTADPSITERDKRIVLAALTAMKAEHHDYEGEEEPRQEAGGTLNSSTSSPADGGAPGGRTPPMSDELAERRKPWKKNLPPQPSPETIADLDRRQREADATSPEEIAGWAAHDGTYPTPDGEKDENE